MKKPIYKRVWVWIIVAFFVIGGIGSIFNNDKDESKQDTNSIKYGETNNKVINHVTNNERSIGWTYAQEQIEKIFEIDGVKIKDNADNFKVRRMPDDKSSDGKIDYKNMYNANGNFEYKGEKYHFSMLYSLKDDHHYTVLSLYSNFDDKTINIPLKSENEVHSENLDVLKAADGYANNQHMSKQGVYNQLTSQAGEKFSASAAQYAIDTVQANWNNNALEVAKSYRTDKSMGDSEIKEQLINIDKFTAAEADYAIQHLN
ncbi:Ltp family lipoprotein [Melissococcus plutonius]|uniref:Ltp family lipoprotein n=3 Tax=Melissococcus plutonius TaxID=33970 RepID=UPI0021E5722D|nr:Ltp family lipoprotein [Melissococcus plutonius]MCV2499510.1 Ltp family lipoprotein [Melissococcus plutonius]MCV2505838.1 Ltp family lipoprotein [Melissococcus plutonius]MCV2508267.1 Ltp family lipoprotein [Melissococcus plutonius]MCV2520673.1 Ltp family lipoprotein [Melissococcus plutonius]MCV2527940.1 Ltp family lipoprotein [Melissococcus plutonius]